MKGHKSSIFILGVLLALGSVESHVGRVHAGEPYGYQPRQQQQQNDPSLVRDGDGWMSRLFKCAPEARQRGFVRVSSPQVYSRQLVYRDRAEEIQFLSDRLRATREFHLKFQGVVDSRFYEALATQLAVNLNPAGGKVLDQTQANALTTAQQDRELADAQHQVQLLMLKQQLAEQSNKLEQIQNKQEGAAAAQPAQDAEARKSIATLQQEVATLQGKITAMEKVPLVGGETNRAMPSLTGTGGDKRVESPVLNDGGSYAKTANAASLTAIEEEKSILEVRRFLQNERRRLSFDDMHDAGGSIMLELGFLLTLMPPAGEDRFAVLELSVERPHDIEIDDLLFTRWADHMAPTIQFERDFIAVRYDNALPYTEKLMDVTKRMLDQKKAPGTTTPSSTPSFMELNSAIRKAVPPGGTLDMMLRQSTSAGLLDHATLKETADNLAQRMQSYVDKTNNSRGAGTTAPDSAELGQKYTRDELLDEYLKNYFGSDFMAIYTKYQDGNAKLDGNAQKEAMKFLNWSSSSGVKVLAVDPTEQGQNLSMVGAVQSIRDNVMSLNAVLGGGVAGSGRSDYYRDSQMYMQSINRKPLLVGFANGSAVEPSFGWILGPRVEVEMKRRWYQLGFLGEKRPTQVFAHEPTAHQVQVALVLPTWVPKLMLKVKAHWIDKRTGLPCTALKTPCIFSDDVAWDTPYYNQSNECVARIPLTLEPDYTALTEGLLDYVHGKRRPPRIFMQYANEKFTLTSSNEGHHLVLLGKDLWRSPTVYLDSLPAASVEVMPGLCGIVATFKGPLPVSDDDFYNVTVSTSGGFDTIKNIVTAPQGQAVGTPASPRLALKTTRLDYDYDAASQPLDILFNVTKNPFPVPPDAVLEGKVHPYHVAKSAEGKFVSAGPKLLKFVLKDPATALKTQLELTREGSTPKAVKITCNAIMPFVNESTESLDQMDVIDGARHVILFKPGVKTFTLNEPTAPVVVTANPPSLTLNFPAGLDKELFQEAYPEYVAAMAGANLRLKLSSGQVSTMLLQKPANQLSFQLPSATEAAEKLGIKGDTKSLTLNLDLLLPGDDEHPLTVTGQVTLKLPGT